MKKKPGKLQFSKKWKIAMFLEFFHFFIFIIFFIFYNLIKKWLKNDKKQW